MWKAMSVGLALMTFCLWVLYSNEMRRADRAEKEFADYKTWAKTAVGEYQNWCAEKILESANAVTAPLSPPRAEEQLALYDQRSADQAIARYYTEAERALFREELRRLKKW